MKKEPVIKVLKVEPDKAPELVSIPTQLDDMQAIVGGNIEVCPIADDVAIVCNAEGKMHGLELNRPLYHDGEMYDIVAGTFFIAGDDIDIGEFVSLTDEQIAKYMKQYHDPMMFVRVNGQIVAIPRF